MNLKKVTPLVYVHDFWHDFSGFKLNLAQTGYPDKCNLAQTGYPGKCNLTQTGYPGKCNLAQTGYPGKCNLAHTGFRVNAISFSAGPLLQMRLKSKSIELLRHNCRNKRSVTKNQIPVYE
jgi:hypothetical protein